MQTLTFHVAERTSHVGRRGEGTGCSTPWGRAQSVQSFARGVKFVSTAGHGGIGISVALANKACLSHEARKIAELHGTTFWFEEDCNFAVACWELGPAFWAVFFAPNGYESDAFGGSALLDASEYRYGKNEVMKRMSVRRYLAQVLSSWNPEYLIARDEAHMLTQPQYDGWKARQLDEQLRREKSPLLIVSAMNKDGEDVEVYGEPVTLVYTADGKHHVVRRGTYKVRTPNYLADCDILDSDVDIDFY